MMRKNIGTLDRTIRFILGIGIIGAGVYFGSWWGALGLIPIATAAMGSCYLYTLLGVSTCGVDGAPKQDQRASE